MRSPRPIRITITRYVNALGERVKKKTPGARKVREQSETWYARLLIDGKPQRVSLKTTDEAQAWVELRKVLRQQADRAAGITDDYQDEARRPLAEHVADWLRAVANKGTSAAQVATLDAHVTRLAELAGWKRVTDISQDSCLEALQALQDVDGRAAQTRNHYLTHIKQFCRWCATKARPRRLREDPVQGISRINVETDRRHDRRCPTDEEVTELFSWLESPEADEPEPNTRRRKWSMGDRSAPIRMFMSARQRALGYRVSMATGYRADELRHLTRASFDLEAGTATVGAAYSKRRRKDTQELPSWLVAELADWFAAGGGLWERFPKNFPGRLLQDDLAGARRRWIAAAGDDAERKRREASSFLAYRTETEDGPLFWDFHALRVWYVTWASNLPGISPKTLMQMARHSTPTLTLKVYAKARQANLRAAIEQMPRPGTPIPASPETGKAPPAEGPASGEAPPG